MRVAPVFIARSFPSEPLEARRLFAAYGTADYLPLAEGHTWTYTATAEGRTEHATLTARSASVEGADTTKFVTSTAVGGNDFAVAQYHSYSDEGLLLHRLDVNAAHDVSVDIEPLTPIRLLPDRFDIGTVGTWSDVPLRISADVEGVDDDIDGEGTESGSATVVGTESVTLANGWVVPEAVKVVIVHTQHLEADYLFQDFELDDTITQELWLAKNVGIVKQKVSVKGTFSGDWVDDQTQSASATMWLSRSSLLDQYVSVGSGTLKLNGASNDDIIAVSDSSPGRRIELNGMVRELSAGAFDEVVVNAFAGDDEVTIGPGVGVAQLLGGRGDDTLRGGDAGDAIYGNDGNDRLLGGAGNDFMKGGAGADKLYGEAGNDTLWGEASADILGGGSDSDSARWEKIDLRRDIELLT